MCRAVVHTGASNLDHGFIKTQATHALASLLKERQLTILALGPLTNVATLLVHHPELRSQIKEIIAVAGRRPGQRFQPNSARPITLADRNFEEDPISFDIVLRSGIPLTLTPYEVASKVTVDQHDLETLGAGTKASRWISHKAQSWSRLWRWVLGTEGFYPFDTLAVGYLTATQQFECEVLPVRIKATRSWLFQTYRTLEVSKHFVGAPEATYCYDVAPEFKDAMLARLMVDAG